MIGISLDTTDPGGHYQGSLGTAQLKWLDKTLRDNKDSYAVVFSHHTSDSMGNTRRDPARPDEKRHDGDDVIALLGSHANVLAWVNGHIHRNLITPHSAPGGRSFWEISTASHVDFPQLARIIELVDNKDGTISSSPPSSRPPPRTPRTSPTSARPAWPPSTASSPSTRRARARPWRGRRATATRSWSSRRARSRSTGPARATSAPTHRVPLPDRVRR